MAKMTTSQIFVFKSCQFLLQKLLFLPVKGELQLDNGKLWGIDTITRPDDVDFEYKDPVADLKSEFMLANLKVEYECDQISVE